MPANLKAMVMRLPRALSGVRRPLDRPNAGAVSVANGSVLARLLRPLAGFRLARMPRVDAASGAGLVMLAASLVLWFSTLQPLAGNVGRLQAEVAQLEARSRAGGPVASSPAAQVRDFIGKLPTRDDLPAVLATIVSQANDAGLELTSGNYEFTPSRKGRIARYRLNFPVHGSYPQVRKFIDGTLAAAPAVALESLKLERENIGDEALDAELGFAVVVRSGT